MIEQQRQDEKIFSDADWWQRDGEFRALHDINPLRLRWLEKVVGRLDNRRLLDWGCGGGIFSESAARAGASVVGYDTNEGAILKARSHAKVHHSDVRYEFEHPPTLASLGTFDVITCFEVVEHVDSPATLIADMATLLAPGGFLVLSTINRTLKAWGTMIVALEVMTRFIPIGTHQYEKFVKPRELADMVKNCDLRVTDVVGMKYSFFGKHYFLDEKDTDVNYFLAARQPV